MTVSPSYLCTLPARLAMLLLLTVSLSIAYQPLSAQSPQ